MRERRADHAYGTHERDVDRALEVVGVDLEDVTEDRGRGVGHDEVEAAERVHRLLDGAIDRVRVGEIGREEHCVEGVLGARPLERLGRASDEGEARALGGEALGGGEADAGGGARDQDAAAAQPLGGVGGHGRDPIPTRAGIRPARGLGA
jgi:hypothetical protein